MIDQEVKCDVCGIAMGETGGWFVARLSGGSVEGIAFLPFRDPLAHDAAPGVGIEHICGETCAHTRLSKWLETFTSPPSERYVR